MTFSITSNRGEGLISEIRKCWRQDEAASGLRARQNGQESQHRKGKELAEKFITPATDKASIHIGYNLGPRGVPCPAVNFWEAMIGRWCLSRSLFDAWLEWSFFVCSSFFNFTSVQFGHSAISCKHGNCIQGLNRKYKINHIVLLFCMSCYDCTSWFLRLPFYS